MLNLRFTLTTILCAMAALFSSCDIDTTPAAGSEPIVELDCYELNVDGYGGDMALFYTITNPLKGQRLEVTSNVDWITTKSINSYSIVLEVKASDQLETRHGIVTVDYKHMARPVKVYVNQDKMIMDYFTISVEDITYNSCTARYTTKDDSIQYMANIIDKQYFDRSGVSTAEEFIAAEMNNYIAIATANDMTLEQLMANVSPQLIYTGEAVRKFAGMQHSNHYVVYCYGVTFEDNTYTTTTPIYHTIVEIPMPTMYSEVDFKVTSQLSSNYIADINITPTGWDGYYYIQIAPDDSLYYIPQGSKPEAYIIKALANDFFITARNYMQMGATAEQFLNARCYSGQQHISVQLERGKRYMIIVFAVESENSAIPVMRSVPVLNYPN